ncbi:alpha-N-acetylgalactosaminide alpha-2,6-sialyltransferase 2 [Elgaria multicarinata webbii]|uniref:alpha-N-acetylgalactosaminide alpha-2,6-sialyltransferase 2 n=1 Tax=Elgaria multicarinata webbii TaxID=159646 RepID=UPI002FCCD453
MGSPRWKRICLLFLVGLTFSIIFYGHYYSRNSPGSPRTAFRLLQQETLGLAQAEIPQNARSHGLTRESIMKSLCPRSLKSKVKIDPMFGKQFDFDIPVLMWKLLFNPETWDRLKERNVPYGWRGLSHAVITSTVQLLNDSDYSRLFSKIGFPDSCIRCAVVGNGGILNGSRQGKEIDAHDFVFRLNGAVIKGFEEDVGTKTSFYGFTVNTMKNSLIAYAEYGFTQVPQAKETQYIFIPSDIRDYVMLKSAMLGIPVPEGYDKGDKPQKYFGPAASAGKFKLLHPEFVYYLTERFLKSELINTQFGHLYMPSTGALMLLTALHTCDQVSAYGFITQNYKTFSDHYYEHEKKPLVFYANHDMLLEAELWKSLHQVGIMKLYQR